MAELIEPEPDRDGGHGVSRLCGKQRGPGPRQPVLSQEQSRGNVELGVAYVAQRSFADTDRGINGSHGKMPVDVLGQNGQPLADARVIQQLWHGCPSTRTSAADGRRPYADRLDELDALTCGYHRLPGRSAPSARVRRRERHAANPTPPSQPVRGERRIQADATTRWRHGRTSPAPALMREPAGRLS
jgi:hypothetical protein